MQSADLPLRTVYVSQHQKRLRTGATAHAITDHQTLEEVERYTKAASRRKTADAAMASLGPDLDRIRLRPYISISVKFQLTRFRIELRNRRRRPLRKRIE